MRILVVEDDRRLLDTLLKGLKIKGHEVIGASEFDKAIAMAMLHRPEVVLSDFELTNDSGLDLFNRIATLPECKDSRFILMTGSLLEQSRAVERSANLKGFLRKPFQMASLMELLVA